MSTTPGPSGPPPADARSVRPRSWAPALLVGHLAVAGVAVVVSLVLLGVGAGERTLCGPVGAVVVGLLVAGGVTRRYGPRPQTGAGRWVTVFALVVVAAWVWYVLGVAGLSGYTGPLFGILAVYLWVYALALVVVAALVAGLDLAVGEVLARRRG